MVFAGCGQVTPSQAAIKFDANNIFFIKASYTGPDCATFSGSRSYNFTTTEPFVVTAVSTAICSQLPDCNEFFCISSSGPCCPTWCNNGYCRWDQPDFIIDYSEWEFMQQDTEQYEITALESNLAISSADGLYILENTRYSGSYPFKIFNGTLFYSSDGGTIENVSIPADGKVTVASSDIQVLPLGSASSALRLSFPLVRIN